MNNKFEEGLDERISQEVKQSKEKNTKNEEDHFLSKLILLLGFVSGMLVVSIMINCRLAKQSKASRTHDQIPSYGGGELET